MQATNLLTFMLKVADLFSIHVPSVSPEQVVNPSGYKGFQSFHKYWGKKPTEPLSLLVECLSPEQGIVIDPFLGGGLLARICCQANRKFMGIDINPTAAELGNLFVDLPSLYDYKKIIDELNLTIRPIIDNTYIRSGKAIGSHYLWNGSELQSVWTLGENRNRTEHLVEKLDIAQADKYAKYTPRNLREITAFSNSRINSTSDLKLCDIFKGRALNNIDVLLDSILSVKEPTLRRSLLLTLSAASGQMSNLVFSINNRKKNANSIVNDSQIEVGSWAIGLWRPKKHFEINVWNCFANRARRFIKALSETHSQSKYKTTKFPHLFFNGSYDCAVINAPYQSILTEAPNNSVDLILTDPPHSDRIPYLELSEFWNSLLQKDHPDFQKEIVISNATERSKNSSKYAHDMAEFMHIASRILRPQGFLCILFNCRKTGNWDFLRAPNGLNFIGRFDLNYSARSIVQDNRRGALKTDFALIYSPSKSAVVPIDLKNLSGWSEEFPQ